MATSFTTHSAGQTILSADINLIQTAVNSLENNSGSVFPAINRGAGASATLSPHAFANHTLSTGVLYVSCFTAVASITTANVRYVVQTLCASSAAGTSIGLYSMDASDNGTLIASVASTTLFTTGGAITKAWASPVAITGGSRYAVAFLNINGSGNPVMAGCATGTFNSAEFFTTPILSGTRSGQSAQASFTIGNLSAAGTADYAVVTV